MSTTVVLENDRVRVLRVSHGPSERHPVRSRGDRLVIYLRPGHIRRLKKGAEEEELHRDEGEVVWREASEHEIENLEQSDHNVLIVELK